MNYIWQALRVNDEPLLFPVGAIVATIPYTIYDASGTTIMKGELHVESQSGGAIPNLVNEMDTSLNLVGEIEFRLVSNPTGISVEYMNRTEYAVSIRFQTRIVSQYSEPYTAPNYIGGIQASPVITSMISGEMPTSNIVLKIGGSNRITTDLLPYTGWTGYPNTFQNNLDIIYHAIQDQSGNILICGRNTDSATLMKFTPTGSLLWQKSFMQDAFTSDPNAFFVNMVIDSSGDIFALGYTSKSETSPLGNQQYGNLTAMLVKLSPTGDVMFIKGITPISVGGIEITPMGLGSSPMVHSDGFLYIAGGYNDGVQKGYIMRLSALDGNLSWISQTSSTQDVIFQNITIDPAGNIIATGLRGTETMIQKINLAGSVLWTRSMIVPARLYGPSGTITDTRLYSIDAHEGNFFINCLTHDGILLWRKNYIGSNGPVMIYQYGGSIYTLSRNSTDDMAFITQLTPDGTVISFRAIMASAGIKQITNITIRDGIMAISMQGDTISDCRSDQHIVMITDLASNRFDDIEIRMGLNTNYQPVGNDVTPSVTMISPTISTTNIAEVSPNDTFVIAEASNSITGSINYSPTITPMLASITNGWSLSSVPSLARWTLNQGSQYNISTRDSTMSNGYTYTISYVEATGTLALSSPNYYVIDKVSSTGSLEWSRSLIADVVSSQITIQADSSGIYVQLHGDDPDVVVMRFDPNGSPVWSKKYTSMVCGNMILQDSTLYLIGQTTVGATDFRYTELNKFDGAIVTTRLINLSKPQTINSVVIKPDGYIILSTEWTYSGIETSVPQTNWPARGLLVSRYVNHSPMWERFISIQPTANNRIDIDGDIQEYNDNIIITGTCRDIRDTVRNGQLPSRFICLFDQSGNGQGSIFWKGVMNQGNVAYRMEVESIILGNSLITQTHIVEGNSSGISIDSIDLQTLIPSWGYAIHHGSELTINGASLYDHVGNVGYTISGSVTNTRRQQVSLLGNFANGPLDIRGNYFNNTAIDMQTLGGIYSITTDTSSRFVSSSLGLITPTNITVTMAPYTYLDRELS